MQSIPQLQVESAMGPALQAAFLVMNHIGGKLLLFQVRLMLVCGAATLCGWLAVKGLLLLVVPLLPPPL